MLNQLDLCITLSAPPADASPETIAMFSVQFGSLSATTPAPLAAPFTAAERGELTWYLETYWQWPYEGFRQRAELIEQSLETIGSRLYTAVTSSVAAVRTVEAWRRDADADRRISIISGVPAALSLPWELLRDEQGFLVLRARHPVSLIRRLPQEESNPQQATFELPLRVLLVTARPTDAGFVDPRGIARELLDEVQRGNNQHAPIEVEFLRPPTLQALTERLGNTKLPPVHVLHFDGHGVFHEGAGQPQPSEDGVRLRGGGRGMLAFETADGALDLVPADRLAEVLNDSGVRLAVLTACQSGVLAADDPFSGVAGRLIKGGVDAVVAMSASVLVASAARYVEAFYRHLAAGTAVPEAHERARIALSADPRRHRHRRRNDEAGALVELRDWWLPHFYQQRELDFQPKSEGRKTKPRQRVKDTSPELPEDIAQLVKLPEPPRYGFSGRAYELLQAERWLMADKLVALIGFGGQGKTTLARELADWLLRTGMYRRALFVSFEQGGDATTLLSVLGHALGVYDSGYDPAKIDTALGKLRSALAKQPVLLIADNLESILPGGEAPLAPDERTRLWDALLALRDAGAGVLLTSRSDAFGDGRLAQGRRVAHMHLGGLQPEDAYTLATSLLNDLQINPARAPYAPLRDLLEQLDQHPLAIQLVLPTLRERTLDDIRASFTLLLPQFKDDQTTGRNRSLLASLEYSLQRLSAEQRALLVRLAPFEGGASEGDLLAITEIPAGEWITLRPALEQAALIRVEKIHDQLKYPFLHFHPVLAPALRGETGANDPALLGRYAERYAALARYLYQEDARNPQPVRALVRRELPNLRRALDLLLAGGQVDQAVEMVECIIKFLNVFGMGRERDELRRRVDAALGKFDGSVGLTRAEHMRESGQGEDEYRRGDLPAAYVRFSTLLARHEVLPPDAPLGRESYEYCLTLGRLARCLEAGGQPVEAETRLRAALGVIERLIAGKPEDTGYLRQCGVLLTDLGDVLAAQGKFADARVAYEGALIEIRTVKDARSEGAILGQLGTLALEQRDYAEAAQRYSEALTLFRNLGEPASEATVWHQLGRVAEAQRQWAEAERCYRASLEIEERIGDAGGAASACNQLAIVAENAGRSAEAEGWYKRALALDEAFGNQKDIAIDLNNLADLLLNEVRAGRAPATRLAEARGYAERALAIRETLDASSEIWLTLSILAGIAEHAGDTEQARSYRRRAREAFADFAGNRWHIDNDFGDLIAAIVAAAQGHAEARAAVEAALPQLEANGWEIGDAVRRIWAGERDWQALCEEIDRNSALLVKMVLEGIENVQ